MDNRAIRAARLTEAIATAGGVAALAARADVSEKYLRQILAGYQSAKDRHPRQLGDAAARKIETGLGKPHGWMDSPSAAMLASFSEPAPAPAGPSPATLAAGRVIPWSEPADLTDEWVIVERRSIKLAAGNGTVVIEHEKLPPLAFRDDYLRSKRVRNRSNLVICYAEGTSMEPALMDGDVLLCDIGQTEIIDGEIYAMDYGGELRVKRVRKRFDGGLLVQSDNVARFPPETLDAAQALHIKILGRILWRGGSV